MGKQMDNAGTGRRKFLLQASKTLASTAAAGVLAACAGDGRRRPRPKPPGTDLQDISCLLPGTQILCPAGPVAVETLRIGDRIMTASGAQRIKWIGRSIHHRRGAHWPAALRPVRIRRSALADNLPNADLLVSKQHSLFLDGVLIPAGQLINGTTILEDANADQKSLELFNIELETHQVILANGLPVETLLATQRRAHFSNAAEYARLYGADDLPARDFAPVLRYGRRRDSALATARRWLSQRGIDLRDKVMRAQDRIAARAALLG